MSSKDSSVQDKSVLKWGALAGIIGGIAFVISMVVAVGFVPAEPPTLTELVARFPDVLTLRIVENIFYLLGLAAGIPLLLSVFWSLRKTSLAPAMFGSALTITGLISMIVMATPHVAHNRISGLYQSATTTPAAQETLGLMWEATWGVTDTPLYVGFFVGMLGFTLIAMATFGSPDYKVILRWVCLGVGVLGFVSAAAQLIAPASDFGAFSFIAYILFYIILGLKTLKLSKI